MPFPEAHPWVLFLLGCWLGAFVGFAVALVLAGSRIQQLESSKDRLQRMVSAKNHAKSRLRSALHERRSA